MFTRVLIVSLMFFPLLDLHAADTSQIWEVNELLKTKSDYVVLRNQQGAILKRLERKQLRIIRKAMSDIESAAERKALLTIVKGDRPNASAGRVEGRDTVLINFAMLDMIGNDRDAWAALLGHEIAHLKLNHGRQARKRRIPLKLAELTVRASTDNRWSQTAAGLASTAIDTKFSRDHERESDYLGLIWAVEKGYDPHGAVTLQTELSKLSKGLTIPFLQSHPSSKERIQKLSRLANKLTSEKKPEPITSEKNPFAQVKLLRVGMATETVKYLMGDPVDVEFAGGVSEWHYCITGSQMDEFIAVTFKEEKLHSLQKYTVTQTDGALEGSCKLNLKRGTYSRRR
jgi:Zn-dependent protease with chaperone function